MAEERQGGARIKENKDWSEAEILRDSKILEHTHSFIVEYNFKTGQCYVDPAQSRYFHGDWNRENVDITKDFHRLVVAEDAPGLELFFDFSGLKPGESRSVDARFFVEPHTYEWFRVSLVCYGDVEGNLERALITFTNAEKELETVQKLKFLLAKDPLTHMSNPDSFYKISEHLIQTHPELSFAVIRMDIDNFRMINQMCGMKEGDNILRYVGVKIQEWMDALEYSASTRLASDLFCVLMPSVAENIQSMIDYIQSALEAYPIPFELVMSFGIYLTGEADRIDHVSMSTLIDRAAAAQRTVKNSYLGHVAYYDGGIRKKEVAEQTIIAEMKQALHNNQFQVYLQPKCEMDTGKIIGSEALVRWIHPKQGIISPGEFIPVFEKNGFIAELDFFVLRSTCQMIRKWLDEGKEIYPVSVNVSRIDLYNPKLLEKIMDCVEEYRVPHELISFELTESAFVSDNSRLYNLAKLLQEHHFHVLMDDFGSGYSSLNSLREIPVDVLKIDLKFLPTSTDDEKGHVILQSVVEMAQRLGLEIVVEGVETIEQAEFLLSIGCKNAQGFYFFKPMTVSDYEQCIQEDAKDIEMRKKLEEIGKR